MIALYSKFCGSMLIRIVQSRERLPKKQQEEQQEEQKEQEKHDFKAHLASRIELTRVLAIADITYAKTIQINPVDTPQC